MPKLENPECDNETDRNCSKVNQVKMDGEWIKIDRRLLFQRLISAAIDIVTQAELASLFSYELCTHPQSLFCTYCLIRAAIEPQVADTILNTYTRSII